MKFIDSLAWQYEAHELKKPQWLKEYTAPVIATSPGMSAPQANTGVSTSIADILATAAKSAGLDADPEVKKISDTVAQKVADAKKQIVDKATKTVDTITKAVQTLNQTSSPVGQSPSSTTPTTPTVK